MNRNRSGPAGKGWYRLKNGSCERTKPCPVGTFRIDNGDSLYEICGSSPKGRNVYFRRVNRKDKP